MMRLVLTCALAASFAWAADIEKAVNAQDVAALDKAVADAKADVQKRPGDAKAQAQLALASSRRAQVSMELGDKKGSAAAAEAGIPPAEEAVKLAPQVAEYHRLLGTLCGQVIPANPLSGISRGHCALDEVDKAVQLDPKSSMAMLSRGIGNYYLPPMFGGGVDKAIGDLKKAVELDAKNAEAHLWLGVALRKANQNAQARAEFEQSLKLNPARKWTQQQLEKTPKS